MTTNNPVTDRAREAAEDAAIYDALNPKKYGLMPFPAEGDHGEKTGDKRFAECIAYGDISDDKDSGENAAMFAIKLGRHLAARDILAGQSVGDLRAAAQQMVDAWAGSDEDAMESAECNLRCALAGQPFTYAATPSSDSPAIPEGMKPWHGGDKAPDDWDPLGPVMLADDQILEADEEPLDWTHCGREGCCLECWCIIAYTPKLTLASHTAPSFIEFAPSFKTINPKPSNQGAATGTFWYAEGWIGGERFEFSAQESRSDAERLCVCLNTALTAVLATPAPSRDEVEKLLSQFVDIACKADIALGDAIQNGGQFSRAGRGRAGDLRREILKAMTAHASLNKDSGDVQ